MNELQIKKFEEELNNRLSTLSTLLGDENFAKRFIKVILNYSYQNPAIFECNRASLLASIYEIASLRLDIGNGQAFLVPYKNIVKPIIGYQGYLTMFYRTGLFTNVYANLVKDGDEFLIEYGTNQKLIHKPNIGSSSNKLVGGYGYARLINGGEIFDFLNYDVLEKRRKLSKVPESFAWKEFQDDMYRKTCIRSLSKWMPRYETNPEILKAIQIDDASTYGALRLDKNNETFVIDYETLEKERKKEELLVKSEEVIEKAKSKKKQKEQEDTLFEESKDENL